MRDTYKKCKRKFIPDGVTKGTLCYCGGQPVQGASMCSICALDMMKQIQRSAEKGKLLSFNSQNSVVQWFLPLKAIIKGEFKGEYLLGRNL